MSTGNAQGGLGGESTRGIRDTRMIEKAIRERWPIPEGKRPAIAQMLCDVAESKDASDRGKIAAAKALIEIDKLNMEQERRDLEIPEYHVQRVEVVSPDQLTDEQLASIAAGGSQRTDAQASGA